MSITFEEAYSSASSLYGGKIVVVKCYENSDEWIFYLGRKRGFKPVMPGDWIDHAVISKSDGAVIGLSKRLKMGFPYFLRFDPLTNGYTQVDLPTATHTGHAAALRVASA
jgi:hypothetical protein